MTNDRRAEIIARMEAIDKLLTDMGISHDLWSLNSQSICFHFNTDQDYVGKRVIPLLFERWDDVKQVSFQHAAGGGGYLIIVIDRDPAEDYELQPVDLD